MGEQERIKLNYSIHSSGEEKLVSIYYNGKRGFIPAKGKSKGMPEDIHLSRLDKIILEKRPLFANLSVGPFKLTSDVAENIGSGYVGGRYIMYEKVEAEYYKKVEADIKEVDADNNKKK